MSLGHVFFADVAADKGHLDLLESLVDDAECDARTSTVLFCALFASVTHIIQSVLLDELLPVQVLGLLALNLQALHFSGPELLLLEDSGCLALNDDSALFAIGIIDLMWSFNSAAYMCAFPCWLF